ncbi:hypothetical protein [Clostridium tagluense]|uniref:Uncharacterized protein n=1 Tax=Clostridium tagluense TaxID=360422 RepID=A0A401UT47_9CLOT|nr:hypothetical protein [Clostridium tagluense]GCD12628.1 hypothetical protein Ctaglu_42510 [Clostridium tagluense]
MMNKTESKIMLKAYYQVYYAQEILGFDKSDSLREFRFMFRDLGFKQDLVEVENKVICEKLDIKGTAKEMYRMIFETFLKYGVITNYDLNKIESSYEELKYIMTEEENKCHLARIKFLIE